MRANAIWHQRIYGSSLILTMLVPLSFITTSLLGFWQISSLPRGESFRHILPFTGILVYRPVCFFFFFGKQVWNTWQVSLFRAFSWLESSAKTGERKKIGKEFRALFYLANQAPKTGYWQEVAYILNMPLSWNKNYFHCVHFLVLSFLR